MDCDSHDDVIKWNYFPRYWPFVRGIHRSPVNALHKGQWRWALMFYLICARINSWVNNREAGDWGRNRAHYDVTVMVPLPMSFCFVTIVWFIAEYEMIPYRNYRPDNFIKIGRWDLMKSLGISSVNLTIAVVMSLTCSCWIFLIFCLIRLATGDELSVQASWIVRASFSSSPSCLEIRFSRSHSLSRNWLLSLCCTCWIHLSLKYP